MVVETWKWCIHTFISSCCMLFHEALKFQDGTSVTVVTSLVKSSRRHCCYSALSSRNCHESLNLSYVQLDRWIIASLLIPCTYVYMYQLSLVYIPKADIIAISLTPGYTPAGGRKQLWSGWGVCWFPSLSSSSVQSFLEAIYL